MTTVAGQALFAGHCLHNKNVTCDDCAAACPRQALAVRPGGPVRDESLCVRCGICATLCPASVFAPHEDNRHLARRLADFPRVSRLVLACTAVFPAFLPDDAQGGDTRAVRLSGCPGALLDATLAACAVSGFRVIDCLRGDCGTCSLGNERTLERVKDLWENLFGTFIVRAAPSSAGKDIEIHDVRTPLVSRRSFFRLPAATLLPDKRFDPLPRLGQDMWHGPDHPRLPRLFLTIVREAPESLRRGAVLPERMRAPFITVDTSRCTACGACSRACPSEALCLSEDGPGRSLSFTPGLCTGCGHCLAVCRAGAVSREALGTLARFIGGPKIFRLGEAAAQPCIRCRAMFAPNGTDDGYCPVCRRKWGLSASI